MNYYLYTDPEPGTFTTTYNTQYYGTLEDIQRLLGYSPTRHYLYYDPETHDMTRGVFIMGTTLTPLFAYKTKGNNSFDELVNRSVSNGWHTPFCDAKEFDNLGSEKIRVLNRAIREGETPPLTMFEGTIGAEVMNPEDVFTAYVANVMEKTGEHYIITDPDYEPEVVAGLCQLPDGGFYDPDKVLRVPASKAQLFPIAADPTRYQAYIREGE